MSPFYRHALDPRLVLTFAVGDTRKARHHIARKPSSKTIIRTNAELYLIVSLQIVYNKQTSSTINIGKLRKLLPGKGW